MRKILALIMLVLTLLGCGSALTNAEIQTNGTKTFSAPQEKVFAAAQNALKAEGYEIATANAEKGIIKTNRKLIRADAAGGSAVAITRQYILTIRAAGNGTKVEAVPKVFQGEADLSDDSVWKLDGSAGERALWQRLFVQIEDNL